MILSEFQNTDNHSKPGCWGLSAGERIFYDTFSRLDTIPDSDGRTVIHFVI